MPVKKIYTSAEQNLYELSVHHEKHLCTIMLTNKVIKLHTFIKLDSEDLSDLINELIYIKKQIEAKEEYNELH